MAMVQQPHDEQAFRRGSMSSGIGFWAHLVLTIAMALMAVYSSSQAVFAVVWYMIGGLGVWAVLWMLYKQHQQERIESLEVEQLAHDDAQAAAIFDEAGEQLAVAKRRLDAFYKWGLNLVAAVTGGYLLIMGVVLGYLGYNTLATSEVLADLMAGRTFLEDASAQGPGGSIWWLLVLQLIVGFVSFLVARYVAGMTKVQVWMNLRGGAGYMMGNALTVSVLAIASFVTILHYPLAYEGAQLVIALLMFLVGFEMIANLVLDLYRPRKPGEYVRPAFDTRILGWLTSPESIGKIISETLNYQFGFELSRSWLYSALGRAVLPLILFAMLVLLVLSSIVMIGPQENGVITRFGQFQRVAEPGLSLKWPYPFGRVEKVDVDKVRTMTIGSHEGDAKTMKALLWTNQHTDKDEQFLVTAPTLEKGVSTASGTTESSVAAGLAGARMTLFYRVNNVKAYIMVASEPKQLLRDIATSKLNAYFVKHDIDSLLTGSRIGMEQQLRKEIQDALDTIDTGTGSVGAGIQLDLVALSTIHPPQKNDVAASFHENIDAKLEMQTAIEEAKREAIETLAGVAGSRDRAMDISKAIDALEPLREQLQNLDRQKSARKAVDQDAYEALARRVAEREVEIAQLLKDAGGEAAAISHQADAYAVRVAVEQRAAANRFNFQLKAYEAAPKYFLMRHYLDTLAEGMKGRRKVIIAADLDQAPTLRINLENMDGQLGLIGPTE